MGRTDENYALLMTHIPQVHFTDSERISRIRRYRIELTILMMIISNGLGAF